MRDQLLIIFLGCFISFSGKAQQNPIALDSVSLPDSYLKRFGQTQSISVLADSIVRNSGNSLTELLNLNSPIYFKENGLGMVSSPSFRGTTASQTAVIWNGININSQLNGQSDFNLLPTQNNYEVSVKSGGGSNAYGSSAIGGSIHLNNSLHFKSHFNNSVNLTYGSFNTYSVGLQSSFGNKKTAFNIGLLRNSSDNDFPISNQTKNINGKFYNQGLDVAIGYKINPKNSLKMYSRLLDSERHFPVLDALATKTKYQDYNTQSLLAWNAILGRFNSTLKAAYLSEKYNFYANINNDNYTYGKAETWLIKYDLAYSLNNKMLLNTWLDFTQNKGENSNYERNTRNIASATLLFKHKINKQWYYELSLRQELTQNYNSPFLYSIGLQWRATPFYTLNLNASKNFRMPTYNDLYWEGSGNKNLKPETSHQIEIINELNINSLKFKLTGYYNTINDMIRWIPTGSIWQPENVDEVEIYGIESWAELSQKINNHFFSLNANYAYTVSTNKKTKKQLTYVPYHKTSVNLAYYWKKININYQHLFVGKVFTTTSNSANGTLNDYQLANLGFSYKLGKTNLYTIGFQLRNVWNKIYQNTLNNPMPKRHFNTYIHLKF